MTLQDCKESIATEKKGIGWRWQDLSAHTKDMFWPEVAQRYARECVKASLKKAAENAEVSTTTHHSEENSYDISVVKKSSITSDSNIVLL